MFQQDWVPVTLKKRTETKGATVVRPTPQKHEYFYEYSKELSDAVSQARTQKKLTRDQLAKACNVTTSLIADLEMRRGRYDADLTNKVLKVLNIKVQTRRIQKDVLQNPPALAE